jgi:hypothetical protein
MKKEISKILSYGRKAKRVNQCMSLLGELVDPDGI